MTIEGNLSKTLLTSVGSVSKLKNKFQDYISLYYFSNWGEHHDGLHELVRATSRFAIRYGKFIRPKGDVEVELQKEVLAVVEDVDLSRIEYK